MRVSDEQWLAAARARAANGEWERRPGEVFEALAKIPPAVAATASLPPALSCPFCPGGPALQPFIRYELLTASPLSLCPNCYGFWAQGDALDRGVADAGVDHPALRQALAPRRCRLCHGRLDDDDVCRSCGTRLPPLECPACARPMDRFDKAGIRLDTCNLCHGTWFDIGEITHVYKVPIPQGLAASTIDEHAADDEPPGWLAFLTSVARIALPYFPG